MCGRRKGGAATPQARTPQGIATHADAFLAYLTARAYSQASIEAHRWALRQFTAWADGRGTDDPAAFTRADLEAYQLFLHHYRSPRGGKPLVTNTQLAGLGCVRRFFACCAAPEPSPPTRLQTSTCHASRPARFRKHSTGRKSRSSSPSPTQPIPSACATILRFRTSPTWTMQRHKTGSYEWQAAENA